MSDQESWQQQYLIKQSEEHRVSRRQFAVFCGCSTVALAAGIPLRKALREIPSGSEPLFVAQEDEIKRNEYKLFRYPNENYPCILIRLQNGDLVAFSQSCTHLMCPVHFDAVSDQLVCPCHSGFFDPSDGSVIAGPPQRSLPRYQVRTENGKILVGPEWEATETVHQESI